MMNNLGLIGLLLILGTACVWFARAWRVHIPKTTPYPFIAMLVVGTVLGAVALYQGTASSAAGWAVGVGLSLLYLFMTGGQKVSDQMVGVGDSIPAFTGIDAEGNSFDSADLAGKRILIKFFRGYW
ncbi:MAG: O-antigen ligase [Gammaproteobacteria bacterium]|jgi:O-antigen ligase